MADGDTLSSSSPAARGESENRVNRQRFERVRRLTGENTGREEHPDDFLTIVTRRRRRRATLLRANYADELESVS